MKSWIMSVGVVLMAAHAMGQDSVHLAFPKVSGNDLNGRPLALPGDFAGSVNLVFIAFEMRQQREVDTWGSFAQEMRKAHPGLQAYELPTIGRGYGIIRGFIDGGMRSGIRDTQIRASTITLYLDVGAFTRALEIESTKSISVVLTKPSGEVLAMVSGPFSDETAAPIVAALDALK